MTWDARQQRAFGWAFLLSISAFYAVLNLGGIGLLLAPLEPLLRPESATDSAEPALWQLALGWSVIALVYVPAYWILAFSTKHFGWSLREWGFGFSPRSWVALGLSALLVALAWWPTAPSPGDVTTGGVIGLRQAFSKVGSPMLLFLGYARIAEELVYRGFALVFLRRFLPPTRYRTAVAILISSALFCSAHTHFAPSDLVSLFLGGALPLAAFTVWSRSLCLALVIHGAVGGGHVGALAALLFYLVLAMFARGATSAPAGETPAPPTECC